MEVATSVKVYDLKEAIKASGYPMRTTLIDYENEDITDQDIKDVVFTGQLTVLKECQKYLIPFEELYGVNMIIPEDAVFATALGSCLAEGQA